MSNQVEVVKTLADREDGEVWTEHGLTFRMDFGAPTLIGAEGYKEIEIDDGPTIDWLETPVFVGIKRGVRTITVTNNRGEEADTLLHLLQDRNGRRMCAWGSYQLDKGLSEVAEGADVVIAYGGKDDISKGREIHRFRVLTTE